MKATAIPGAEEPQLSQIRVDRVATVVEAVEAAVVAVETGTAIVTMEAATKGIRVGPDPCLTAESLP